MREQEGLSIPYIFIHGFVFYRNRSFLRKKFNWHLKFCQIKKRTIERHENAFKMVMYQNRGYVNATMLKQIINKNLFNIKLSVHEFFHTSSNTNYLNITNPILKTIKLLSQ